MKARPERPRTRAAFRLAVALLLALPALAAEKKPERPGRFHAGPFWLTPKIELYSAGRNTNVYNQEFGSVADAAAILSPGLRVDLPVGRRSRFSANGTLRLNWFHEQATERSTDGGFMVRGETDVGPVTLFGETGRGWYKQRFSMDLDERLPYSERTAAAGAAVKLGSKFKATGSISAGRFDIDEAGEVPGVSSSLDHDTRTIRLEGRYALTGHTGLLVSNEWIRDEFDQAIGAASPDVNSNRLLGGFEFNSRPLAGHLLAGVRDYPAEPGAAAPSYRGPALSAGLTFPATSWALVKVQTDRDVAYASRPALLPDGTLARNSYVTWNSRAEVAFELPFDLLLRTLLGFDDANYQLPYATAGAPGESFSHRWTYGGTLLRVFADGFKIGGGVTWEERAGQSPNNPYHGATWGLAAEYTP